MCRESCLSGLGSTSYIEGFGQIAGQPHTPGIWTATRDLTTVMSRGRCFDEFHTNRWKLMDDKLTNDKAQSSPWDKLLDDLGAQPDVSAFERHQPPPQEIPPTAECPEATESAAEPKASSSAWNSLAESLGLEVEEPVQIELEKEHSTAPEAEFEPPEPETAEVIKDTLAGFAAPEQAAFLKEIDDDINPSDAQDELPPLPSQMDQALSETAWEESSEENSDRGEADATDKVDDERDGISGEAARSAFDALFSDGASSWGSAFLQKPKHDDSTPPSKSPFADDTGADDLGADGGFEDDGTEDDGDTDAALPDSPYGKTGDGKTGAANDEEESERPKRKRSRRRRRGGKGRKPAGERVAEGEASEESSSDGHDELSEKDSPESTEKPKRRRSGHRSRPTTSQPIGGSGDETDFDDEILEGEESSDGEEFSDGEESSDGDNPRGAGRGRQRHRNLPTWSEAIGMIVDSNLEQRAKSPDKPQSSRGRGGRGGRRRGKKPENK